MAFSYLSCSFQHSAGPVFKSVLDEEAESVHRHEGYLENSYGAEFVIKEVLKIMNDLCSDAKAKVFKQTQQ